jgi:hypothetical protein
VDGKKIIDRGNFSLYSYLVGHLIFGFCLISSSIIMWNIFGSLLVIFYFFEIPISIAWGNVFWIGN